MSDKTDKNFINETVAKNKKSLKEWMKDGAIFCVEALAFGIIAAMAFSIMEPRVKNLFGKLSAQIVTVSNDEDDETTDGSAEQIKQNSEVVKLNEVLNSVVLIECRTSNLDTNGQKIGEEFDYSSGAVLSTGDSTLLLTDYETVKNSDFIKVTFEDNTQCEGRVLSVDRQLGIAIVSVDTKGAFKPGYSPNKNVLGKSEGLKNGDELLYVGMSEGVGKINLMCEIITTDNMVQYTDCIYSMFTTDMASNVARNGFVFNEEKQLIGMIARPENNGIANLVAALGVTDIKPVIDKLTKGTSLPYMGINGTTVTDQLKENVNPEMPYGVYVTSVETNSPAYRVGILNGDIITKVAGRNIKSVKEFSNTINSLDAGNSVEVTVNRHGKNGYKKLTFNVIIGGKEN